MRHSFVRLWTSDNNLVKRGQSMKTTGYLGISYDGAWAEADDVIVNVLVRMVPEVESDDVIVNVLVRMVPEVETDDVIVNVLVRMVPEVEADDVIVNVFLNGYCEGVVRVKRERDESPVSHEIRGGVGGQESTPCLHAKLQKTRVAPVEPATLKK